MHMFQSSSDQSSGERQNLTSQQPRFSLYYTIPLSCWGAFKFFIQCFLINCIDS